LGKLAPSINRSQKRSGATSPVPRVVTYWASAKIEEIGLKGSKWALLVNLDCSQNALSENHRFKIRSQKIKYFAQKNQRFRTKKSK
jgi:hypothetical protein